MSQSVPAKTKDLEKTFCMIKPNATKNYEAIATELEAAGFSIVRQAYCSLRLVDAEKLYQGHRGQCYYNKLIFFITSGQVVLMILERENAVQHLRDLMGDKDPAKAEEGTLRRKYGDPSNMTKNAIHGSDSKESAEREIAIFFS